MCRLRSPEIGGRRRNAAASARPCRPCRALIEDQQHAPVLGKRQPADAPAAAVRRRRGRRRAPRRPARRWRCRCSSARRDRAAGDLAGIAAPGRRVASTAAPIASAELRARAEADMVRYRNFDAQRQAATEPIALGSPLGIGAAPASASAPEIASRLPGVDRHARARRIDGDAEAAEAAAELAVEVDKSQMQPAGTVTVTRSIVPRSRASRCSAEVRVAGLVVSEYHGPCQCCLAPTMSSFASVAAEGGRLSHGREGTSL